MPRKAEFMDLFGSRSKQLYAVNPKTGQRISARKFYGLPGTDQFTREGFVLMTTAAAAIKHEPRGKRLFDGA